MSEQFRLTFFECIMAKANKVDYDGEADNQQNDRRLENKARISGFQLQLSDGTASTDSKERQLYI